MLHDNSQLFRDYRPLTSWRHIWETLNFKHQILIVSLLIDGYAVFPPTFPLGSGPILLDNAQCSGLENSLLECEYLSSVEGDCAHQEDAGVRCLSHSQRQYSITQPLETQIFLFCDWLPFCYSTVCHLWLPRLWAKSPWWLEAENHIASWIRDVRMARNCGFVGALLQYDSRLGLANMETDGRWLEVCPGRLQLSFITEPWEAPTGNPRGRED